MCQSGKLDGAIECPDVVTHKVTFNAVILEKRESSQAVRGYDDVTREDLNTPLGGNRHIIY